MTRTEMTQKLMSDYGFTAEQIEADRVRIANIGRKLNAMTAAGRERGTVDHNADIANFRNA